MKKLLHIFLFLYFTTSSAQFAHINDPDGKSNVRSSAEEGDNILCTLPNRTLVYSVPVMDEGEWRFINYALNGKEASGWIYESRLKYVGDHQKIPLVRYTDKESELAGSNIKIVFIQRDFDTKGKKIGYSTVNVNTIDTIDGNYTWGTDGNMPEKEYESITIWLGDKKIVLPHEALQGLYEPNLDYVSASYQEAADVLYIETSNSDGAGSYDVLWIIEKGKYKERRMDIGF